MAEESLKGAVENVVNGLLETVHTAIPGEIVTYDGVSATVRPLLKKVWADGSTDKMPEIQGVPVVFLGNNRGGLIFDLLPGDTGIIHFSERDFTNWLLTGNVGNQGSAVKFDYNDAVFVPGLRPKTLPHTGYAPLQTNLYRSDAGLINFYNASQSHGTLMKELIDEIMAIATFGSPASHVLTPAVIAKFLVIQLKYITLSGS